MNAGGSIIPVILSGGSGTRLWPLSTPECPKQFLDLVGSGRTMFQATLARSSDPAMFSAPVIVANARHRRLVVEQLNSSSIEPRSILLEPAGRNTAPAIALAAIEIGGDDSLMLVMPSDHLIGDCGTFLEAVRQGTQSARKSALVTFGITPTHAATGYGYIAQGDMHEGARGVFDVARFIEKPDEAVASEMLDDGGYLWNAGIFLFSARSYLAALERYQPDILRSVRGAMENARRDGAFVEPEERAFLAAPSQSIDYGILERSQNVVTVPTDCDWSDVGSWDAVADLSTGAIADGALRPDVTMIDCAGTYVHSDGRPISLCGVRDMIVVAANGELLIIPRGSSQRVREVVSERA